jgi:hypothetical protein
MLLLDAARGALIGGFDAEYDLITPFASLPKGWDALTANAVSSCPTGSRYPALMQRYGLPAAGRICT